MRSFPFIAVLTVIAGLAAAGCGGGPERADCAYVDASGSTQNIRLEYLEALEGQLASAAERGLPVRVVVGTGAPLVESAVLRADFSDVTGLEAQPQRESRLAELLDDVEGQIADSEAGVSGGTQGSGIAAGLTLVARGGACSGVTAYSDGHETADINVYRDDILSSGGRRRLIDRMRSVDRVASLAGARVDFPMGGQLPGGTRLSDPRQAALDDWWVAWTKSSGGSTRWGR